MIEIIAEIGINHNGLVDRAGRLIEAARSAGCDTVKFQLWNAQRSYGNSALAGYELSPKQMRKLKGYAGVNGLRFLCTPDTIEDARDLREMGVERLKIGSSNITNIPLLREIGQWDLPVLLSTGAATLLDVKRAVDLMACPVTLMHCVSAYPAPVDQMNMRVISTLAGLAYRPIGFSDHTQGSVCAIVALALGARVFEKHLTLDHMADGPDHAMSCEPAELRHYVQMLRSADQGMLGDGRKVIQPCERENRREYEGFVARQMGLGVDADSSARAG